MENYLVTREALMGKLNVLIYGDPGSGKTYLAGTAQDVPEMANVHFFNVDGGLLTLADRGDIHASDVHSLDELEAEFWKFANKDKEYSGVRTIVIDNVSELQTLALEEEAASNLTERRRKDKNYTIDQVYLDDYGIAGRRLARILRGFRDLPLNVIYIAHRKDIMRRGTNVLEESRPNLTQKLGTSVMGYMDVVGYLYTGEEQVQDGNGVYTEMHRYLLLQPANNFAAKVRGEGFAKALGQCMVDPDFTKIYDAFKSVDD